tara:strand:- start:214 stop:1194 length:981 start_codon:yes stop_codon:yes gene_type:complete
MATKRVSRWFPGGRTVVLLGLALGGLAGLSYVSVTREQVDRAQLLEVARRQPFAPIEIVQLGLIPAELNESSGLGVSQEHPGVFWTHNDSGDEARVYALDERAMLVATVAVDGVEARDWEAMTLGRCPHESERSCLYAADIGDNRARREQVEIHVIEEPDPADGDIVVAAVASLTITYPDGPHDAEGIAVTPAGDLVIVTKEQVRSTLVFTLPADQVRAALESGATLTPAAGRPLPIVPDREIRRYATGATFTLPGDRLVIRTYRELFVFTWPLEPDAQPLAEPCFLGQLDPQGEAIGAEDDGWLVLTSESPGRRRGGLHRVRCDF